MTENGLLLPPELVGQTSRHAVYRCYSDQGELLYVGTTGHLGRRLAAHAEKLWFAQVRGITLEWYPDELEAGLVERRAIHVEHPKYNVQHRNSRPQNGKRRTGRRSPRLRVSGAETEAQALKLLADEPDISGGELGRRLGKSESYGCRLKKNLAGSMAGPDAN
jgi:predicted GIY-YIG superfamily endonuclease